MFMLMSIKHSMGCLRNNNKKEFISTHESMIAAW